MTPQNLKFVLVPWGASSGGDDVWLLENALIFGVETIFEKLEIPFADLYDQLQGEAKKTAIVRPYGEADLIKLASRAPADTTALVDGLISVIRSPESSTVCEIEFAPRILQVRDQTFLAPDAFRYEPSFPDKGRQSSFEIEDLDAWHALVIMLAESLLQPFGFEVPPHIGPETLKVTDSSPAYTAFLKGKRGARTVEEKLGYYRQANRLDPRFYWARFNAAQLHKQQEDYHSARREFLAALQGADNDPALLGDVYFELGLCSIFLGDTKTARKFWTQALTFTPSNPVLLVNVAGTFEQEENWESAIRYHQLALDTDPAHYKALVSLGRLKAQSGLIDEAIPLYEKALALRPTDSLRHAILGGCYLSLGEVLKARSYFERASELDPDGSRAQVRIDEADAPPAPGEYARQELVKLDEAEARVRRTSDKRNGGWRWFGR